MHQRDPGLALYQARTQLMGSATAARSLGINPNLVIRDGMDRVRASGALERYVKEKDERAAARCGFGSIDGKKRDRST